MLIEPFRNGQKEHDPAKVIAYHEAGHGLVMLSFGLLPQHVSLEGFSNTVAYCSNGFIASWDIGTSWETEGIKYLLMLDFGGIVGGALFSGKYDWAASANDIKGGETVRDQYGISFREYLGAWVDTHDIINDNSDLLTLAAEKLHRDTVLGVEFWEGILLSPMKNS